MFIMREQVDVIHTGEQQMLQTPVKTEVKQEEIKEENTTEEQQSDEDDDEQQMLQTPLKMCSVKLLDCMNLMKVRGETTAEEEQSDEDDDETTAEEQQSDKYDDDFIPAGLCLLDMSPANHHQGIVTSPNPLPPRLLKTIRHAWLRRKKKTCSV
ncbi:VID27-like protein [Myxocyprinus asiaticus]|uniref:VID27-like protein n=1 Tax=Myxocyprinus asiaticus TaxID=70543 RepID=UPI002221BD18|nr:VID27-like protein [Myxocyprinus asiaticus]